MEEILERQLLIRGRAFATFSTIAKALAGRMQRAGHMLCRPGVGHSDVRPWNCFWFDALL